jgi:hypothetical protein
MHLMFKRSLARVLPTLWLFLSATALAQNPASPVNPCRGSLKLLSSQQENATVTLEIEVTVADCKGSCLGSVEYTLHFADADGQKIQWFLTESWNWQTVTEPFTLKISKAASANATLTAVAELAIGRCSCAGG